MEQSRFLLFLALTFSILLVWNVFFTPKSAKKEANVKSEIVKKEEKKEIKKEDSKAFALKKALETSKRYDESFVTVENSLYSINIDKKGAVFSSVLLKKYKEKNSKNSPQKNLIDSIDGKNLSLFYTSFAKDSFKNFNEAVFTPSLNSNSVDVTSGGKRVSFFWVSPDGIKIEKEFVFYPDKYLIDFNLKIYNQSNRQIQDTMVLSLLNSTNKKNKTRSFSFEGPSAFIGDKLVQVKIDDIKDENFFSGDLKWIAFQSRYFMSAIIPKEKTESSLNLLLSSDENIVESQYLYNMEVIHPSSSKEYKFKCFIGPKSVTILKKAGYDLNKAVHFGFFDFIAKPLLMLMNFLYAIFHNYGVAIILLTLFTKLIFFPLGNKSYKSMNEMKKLQPIFTEIRAKYKDDKKKMNEEIMSLYKTYKVNPLGGCLPILVQIPIFFALYRMLYEAIELRHAPFFWWIQDLSAPDRLFSFSFSIPFMQEPYGIPVLTFLMGISMYFQQKMTPTTADPTQAKIMALMPVIMIFIFINFPSGLVLYWLVNNIFSILQQYYVTKDRKKRKN